MDNITLKKVYDEDGLIELKVQAIAEFVGVYQFCYIQDIDLKKNAEKIIEYSRRSYKDDCYIEFGNKDGQYTPAFSLKIMKADSRGHVKIEVDLEIADNEERKHRCSFFVKSELGMIEQFGYAMNELISSSLDTEIELLK